MNNHIKIVIGALVIAGIFFFAGSSYAKTHVSNTASQTARAGGAGQGAQFGRGGARGGAGGGFVSGTILSKDAQSLTVSVMGGGSKIVFLGTSTPIMKSVAGTANDLSVGSNVVVTGTTNADGSVTARSVEMREIPSRGTNTNNQ